MFNVSLNQSERRRLDAALDNWGNKAGKRASGNLKMKLAFPAADGGLQLSQNDLIVILRIATWAGALKKPRPRAPNKKVKK